MSEWLDLMLDEVARKEREAKEAREEQARRDKQKQQPVPGTATEPNQSK